MTTHWAAGRVIDALTARLDDVAIPAYATWNQSFIEFKFAGTTNETLVFDREQLEEATEDVLDDAGIRSRASDDILPIIEGE